MYRYPVESDSYLPSKVRKHHSAAHYVSGAKASLEILARPWISSAHIFRIFSSGQGTALQAHEDWRNVSGVLVRIITNMVSGILVSLLLWSPGYFDRSII
jgi:hypothetical protein